MSDAIKTAAARIKEDALNLAERARTEAASAFASVNDHRDELRAKATETAKLAGEVISENARIASDLARRNANAAAHIISDNAKALTTEMGPLRDKAGELAQDASERLTVAARELSAKVSQNSKYAADQARAHPAVAIGLAAGGIALIAAAIALTRKSKVDPAPQADENSDYVDPSVVPSTTSAAGAPYTNTKR
ncbi:MAG: hypothetical protein HEQ21_16195 [Blastomonas sp.]|uniref:hypothetical protein n=1 Tax=Blastomonas sp. TaxID=1909299 RepID=UPI00258DD567|nr:hypothetical protein [Blastomonas sp.]MCO5794360.1 hypothetical protein [Blastomonas sp.]